MTDVKRVFMVDGKPFYPLGGEADNQSGRSDSESETAFKAVKIYTAIPWRSPCTGSRSNPKKASSTLPCVDAPNRQCSAIWTEVNPPLVRYLVWWQYGLRSGVGEDQSAAFQADCITYRHRFMGSFPALSGES